MAETATTEPVAASEFAMPSLGSDMDEGTVIEWLVGVGDRVERGDVIAVVDTDKAEVDVEIWHPGVVEELLVPVGRTVPVGTPLARLAGGRPLTPPPPVRPPLVAPTPSTPAAASADGPGAADRQPRSEAAVPSPIVTAGPGASPLARRLAGERRIDLTAVIGSGPGGAILARDLDRARASDGGADGSRERMRRAVATTMARANREIPHYHLATEIDLEPALTSLEARNRDLPVSERILPAALLLVAAARSLAEHRDLNGHWVDDRFVPGDGVHLGVAISLRQGGLVAPAIRDADGLGVAEMMATLRDLVGRARAGRLTGFEMTAATATVTNLGERGVRVVHGVIHPPQVALIGFGQVAARPAVLDGAVVARRQVTASLAADHRASDGQRGARLLNAIDRFLQRSEPLP